MTERDIFLTALEHEDLAGRAAYLDAACAGRPALRRRVEALLRCHHADAAFLTVPVMEQLAAAEESLAFLSPPAEPGSLGRLDHYEVLEVVGRGGTGVVFKARDTKLQRVVAVKALAPRLAASAAARGRFVREAQAAAAVRDDNVVSIHAVSDDGPVPYLVMEYICGQTLEQRVRQDKDLALNEVLRIGMQVAAGLAAAHAQGLVHRDIKPANILLENGVQRVKITDFGLARVAADAGPADAGGLAGTPLYMSPEQARGEPTDHRTDLFSLGSVLYTLCAGRPAFRADTTAEVLCRIRAGAPQPVREVNPDVPEWLGGLITRLHAKEASARPASAREVADLLGERLALLQQPPLGPSAAAAPAESPRTPTARPAGEPRPRRRLLVAALVGILIALAALAAWLKPWQRPATGAEDGGTAPRGPARPLDLRRDAIPRALLALAGRGDPARAPPELAAVLGDGKFLLPRVGQTAWMEQSPDGKLLAVPLDEDVTLFDVPTGAYLRTLKGPGGRVFSVTFSRDNRLLAAGTRNGQEGVGVRVWDLGSDAVLFTDAQPGPTVSCAVAFSGNGRHLFTEGDGRVHVWDARTGARVQDLAIHPQGVGPMCVSPDGRRLAVADYWDKCVKVFDWDGKELTEVRTLTGHSGYIGGVAYSPDGKFLASGDRNGFRLWDAATLAEVAAVETSAEQVAFAPDGRTLFAATTIGPPRPVYTFTRWDVGTRKELPPLAVEVSADSVRAFHGLSRDGKVLFVAPQHGATHVRMIDADTGKERYPRRGHVASLNAVAVSPDGRTAASAGEDRVVKVWDLESGQVLNSFAVHTQPVWGLAFSPDGRLLASGSSDGTIALWDLGSGAELRVLRGHSRSPSRIRFSPDGASLAAGGEGNFVKRWDVADGRERGPLHGHTGAVRCVAFSPDGKLLAAGGEDRSVRVHDLVNGGARKFAAPTAVNDVAFSPDGRTLAAVGDAPESAVRLWDLDTGQETTWPGHAGNVLGVAFSPSGPLLATCGDDGTVRLWDWSAGPSGVRTIGPGPFGGSVRAVAFTPDGRYLAAANANGLAYLLRVEPER